MKSPDDLCKRCTHPRWYHNPPKFYATAKTGYSSGNAHLVPILTACCWYAAMCTCLEFIE